MPAQQLSIVSSHCLPRPQQLSQVSTVTQPPPGHHPVRLRSRGSGDLDEASWSVPLASVAEPLAATAQWSSTVASSPRQLRRGPTTVTTIAAAAPSTTAAALARAASAAPLGGLQSSSSAQLLQPPAQQLSSVQSAQDLGGQLTARVHYPASPTMHGRSLSRVVLRHAAAEEVAPVASAQQPRARAPSAGPPAPPAAAAGPAVTHAPLGGDAAPVSLQEPVTLRSPVLGPRQLQGVATNNTTTTATAAVVATGQRSPRTTTTVLSQSPRPSMVAVRNPMRIMMSPRAVSREVRTSSPRRHASPLRGQPQQQQPPSVAASTSALPVGGVSTVMSRVSQPLQQQQPQFASLQTPQQQMRPLQDPMPMAVYRGSACREASIPRNYQEQHMHGAGSLLGSAREMTGAVKPLEASIASTGIATVADSRLEAEGFSLSEHVWTQVVSPVASPTQSVRRLLRPSASPTPREPVTVAAAATSTCSSRAWWEVLAQARASRREQDWPVELSATTPKAFHCT